MTPSCRRSSFHPLSNYYCTYFLTRGQSQYIKIFVQSLIGGEVFRFESVVQCRKSGIWVFKYLIVVILEMSDVLKMSTD